MSEERFLSTEEVAERLQVDEQTIRRWIKFGKLEAFKPGREWRIPPAALEALQASYSSPKAQAQADIESGDERLEDRLAPRVARLESMELSELSELRRELAETLADLKDRVEFGGGEIDEIRDWPAYLEATDELLALTTVLERTAGRVK